MSSLFPKIINSLRLIYINIIVTILLLIVVELFCLVIYRTKDINTPLPYYYSHEDFYMADWVPQYVKDAKNIKYEFWGMFPENFSSKTIKFQKGYRESVVIKPATSEYKKVYCFGGSTMWGEGVSDEFTIPSILNQNTTIGDYEFFNFGIQSYTTEQQILNLSKILMDGQRPDYVIFYDGANHIASMISPLTNIDSNVISGKTASLIYILYKKTNISRAIDGISSRFISKRNIDTKEYILTTADIDIVDKAIELYINRILFARNLLNSMGIKSLFFLQPYLLSGIEVDSGSASPKERSIYFNSDPRAREMTKLFYSGLRSRMPDFINDLSEVFLEKQSTGHYFDPVHLTNLGNKIIADRISDSFK